MKVWVAVELSNGRMEVLIVHTTVGFEVLARQIASDGWYDARTETFYPPQAIVSVGKTVGPPSD
jgi:hypothetical protein